MKMEKLLLIKNLDQDNIPSRSRFLSLPHKHVVMIYTILSLLGFLYPLIGDGFRRSNYPLLVGLLYSVLSFAALTQKKPEIIHAMLKPCYFFVVMCTWGFVIATGFQLIYVLFRFIDGRMYSEEIGLVALFAVGLLITYSYAVSILYYLSELKKESPAVESAQSDLPSEVTLNCDILENKFLFIFPRNKINFTYQRDILTFSAVLNSTLPPIFWGFRVIFEVGDDRTFVWIFIILGVLLYFSAHFKKTNCLRFAYYFSTLCFVVLSIYSIETYKYGCNNFFFAKIVKFIIILGQLFPLRNVFDLWKLAQFKENPEIVPVSSEATQGVNVNITQENDLHAHININEYTPK